MPSQYNKNYTQNGYLMNYVKPENHPFPHHYVLQFRIELQHVTPLIWRRILVPPDYNFWDLHVAIQDSMGWLDYHLHDFRIRGKSKQRDSRIGIPDFEQVNDEEDEILPGWEIPGL